MLQSEAADIVLRFPWKPCCSSWWVDISIDSIQSYFVLRFTKGSDVVLRQGDLANLDYVCTKYGVLDNLNRPRRLMREITSERTSVFQDGWMGKLKDINYEVVDYFVLCDNSVHSFIHVDLRALN